MTPSQRDLTGFALAAAALAIVAWLSVENQTIAGCQATLFTSSFAPGATPTPESDALKARLAAGALTPEEASCVTKIGAPGGA